MTVNTSQPELDIVGPAEFDELFRQCSNWGRWGEEEQRGTLNNLTEERTVAAATRIRSGTTVSCARAIETKASIDNPDPADHHMTKLPIPGAPGDEVGGACDFLGVACHGEVHSHIDALCHISYRGKLYNGFPADSVSRDGASVLDLDQVASGIATRGVLLDVAARRGKRWLDPGDLITREELVSAERAAEVSVGAGDVVLIRTGQALRREVEGPWDSATQKAGLHPRAMPWFRERDVAAVGFDGDGDAAPHPCPSVRLPIHVLGINATGLHTFDALSLESLARECSSRQTWTFFFVALPVRLRGGTGCAINPVAIF